jgi:hypothetical protein
MLRQEQHWNYAVWKAQRYCSLKAEQIRNCNLYCCGKKPHPLAGMTQLKTTALEKYFGTRQTFAKW